MNFNKYKNIFSNTLYKREYSQNDFMQDLQLFKFFVSIYSIKAQFKERLENQFNLTSKQLQKYSEVLESQGLITFQRFTELDEITQEIIYTIEPDPKNIYLKNPKMYIITPKGLESGRELVEKAYKEYIDNEGVQIFLNNIKKQSKAYHQTKNKILFEENLLEPRTLTHPLTGLKYEKETKAQIKMKKYLFELKQIKNNTNNKYFKINELDKQLLSLDASQRQELIELYEDYDNNQKKEKVYYNGIYSHLTGYELSQLSNEIISQKDINKINKELKEEREQKYSDYIHLTAIINKKKLFQRDIEYLNAEAEKFLICLGGYN